MPKLGGKKNEDKRNNKQLLFWRGTKETRRLSNKSGPSPNTTTIQTSVLETAKANLLGRTNNNQTPRLHSTWFFWKRERKPLIIDWSTQEWFFKILILILLFFLVGFRDLVPLTWCLFSIHVPKTVPNCVHHKCSLKLSHMFGPMFLKGWCSHS
jgi:hypothetical protein